MTPYKDFSLRLKLLISKNPQLITTTLSNIFTMRMIGNKTHGDLAEIAISEFINQYMYDFKSEHVGKDLFRSKEFEEDLRIVNEINQESFALSLKAYGDGPLQLSTDRKFLMYPKLLEMGSEIEGDALNEVWADSAFAKFSELNILPLIYNEKKQQCNVLIFDHDKAMKAVTRIVREDAAGGTRKHSVYRFYDSAGHYVCEVRYGSGTANALQRGLWTHTKNGFEYFDSMTSGWINYTNNPVLVKLFAHALLATSAGHDAALADLRVDIEFQRKTAAL